MFIKSSVIFLLFPLNLFSMNLKTTCDLFKFPRECHCQPIRYISINSFNETRLRCRQLTDITTNSHWSKIRYDRLIFETSNDNLTLHSFAFANIIVRTLRFYIENLFLQDHIFDYAHIGQLFISNDETYCRINLPLIHPIFYGATITNLYFKSIDFQNLISELIFSNAKIYIFLIESSKFYGFINKKFENMSKIQTKMKYNHFLEYEFFLPTNLKKIQFNDDSSSIESEQTIIMNITSINYPIYIKIYTIISSINTTNLTENYFPNNLDYNQLEEIELSFNQINSLDAYVFRHLKEFQGRLILKNNQIKYLNFYAFDHLFLIKNLSLKTNFIQNLSSRHFQDLKQLYELDLSFNQIYQLNNNTFQYLKNLHILYLNYNPLEFIHPNTFSNLTQLKQIHFQGVRFIHSIDQLYFQWIWNLASLHVIHLLQNNFELSDVAFCILSHYNQTLFHLSRQHSCSCNIHYFNLNQNLTENTSISILKYQTNYLRLTPICNENNTDSNFKEQIPENDLILKDLENQCDYQLMFLDCDAMTTTTVQTTTLLEMKTETDIFMQLTTEKIPVPTTTLGRINISTPKNSLHNMKKLFTVLGTLIAITIGAIIFLLFWYRLKTILKRRKKKKSFVEQQQHFNSPAINNHLTTPRYASSDISGSIYSEHLSMSKSQSEALIEPPVLQTSPSCKNIETIENNYVENFIDDESLKQDSTEKTTTTTTTTEMQEVTQC